MIFRGLIFWISLSAWPAGAEEFGRLFFTPEERKQLENPVVRHPAGKAPRNESAEMVVNGFIQRTGGQRIIWVNGRQQAPVEAQASDPVKVSVPGREHKAEVKVGQKLVVEMAVSSVSGADAP